MRLLESLRDHPPRYGPEWGSGGIFGLKSHRGLLYYTLAFEAEAHFIFSDGSSHRYDYTLVGPQPTSGGDTYNAVEAIDNYVYFGGWVHAPAVYKGKHDGSSTISFINKYSHVHYFDLDERRVGLLWRDGICHEELWAGEVSEIIYNPVDDRLLIARGDGHEGLGVYSLDRRRGAAEKLTGWRALKGAIFLDHACFDASSEGLRRVEGVQCIDLSNRRVAYTSIEGAIKRSVDGQPPSSLRPGAAASIDGRFMVFVGGGIVVGDPLDEYLEPLRFVRLLDLGLTGYGPFRTVAKPLGGGVIVAFNSFTQGVLRPSNAEEEAMKEALNSIVAPTTLVYITPPIARIVGVYGARITSIETVGDKLVLAANTSANLLRMDATPIDVGYRGFLVQDLDFVVAGRSPPARFHVRLDASRRVFGGFPLAGYKRPEARVYVDSSARLEVAEYDLSMPEALYNREYYDLGPGWNRIDLSGYGLSIVSFSIDRVNEKTRVVVDLK